MDENKNAKIIVIGQIKGGSGKSTVTSLIASHLHQLNKKKVLVIDADDDSQSISLWRQQDEFLGLEENKMFEFIDNVLSANVLDILKTQISFYDYIFIDLPGNLKQEGIKTIYTLTDYVFIIYNEELDYISFGNKLAQYITETISPYRVENGLKEVVLNAIIYNINDRLIDVKTFLNNAEELIKPPILKSIIPTSKATFNKKTTVDLRTTSTHYYKHKLLFKEVLNIIEN